MNRLISCFWVLLIVGLGLMLGAFSFIPVCDDMWRYLWEGELLLRGGDPWFHAPIDFIRKGDLNPFLPMINHPEYPAIYPGLLIGFFAALRWLGLGVVGFRVTFMLCLLGLALWVRYLARKSGQKGDFAFALVWLNPLAVYEVAGRGHFEPMLGLALLAGTVAIVQNKPGRAGILWAMAVQVKTLAGALVGFVHAWNRPRSSLFTMAAGLTVMGLTGLVFPTSILGMWKTGFRFGMEFESDDLIPFVLQSLGLGWGGARIASGAILVGAVLWLARNRMDPYERSHHAIFWLLACLPTFHAWYALWLLPFAALRPRPWSTVFLFSALFYEFGHTGAVWTESGWVRWAVWLPPLAFYLADPWLSMSSFPRWMSKGPSAES